MKKSVEYGVTTPNAGFDKISPKKGGKVEKPVDKKQSPTANFKNMWGK